MPRIDLVVPFGENDEARLLGARWDGEKKVWFVPDGVDAAALRRWLPPTINIRSSTYYIAGTFERCWSCDKAIEVFCCIVPAGYEVLDVDAEDEEDIWDTMSDVAILSHIEYLSPTVASRIRALTPHYRRARSRTSNKWYWMNHCKHCGLHQGDHALFREPEGGFLPTDVEGARAIDLHSMDQPLEAAAAYAEAEAFAYLWEK